MRGRLLAGAILVAAGIVGWLSITSVLVARLLQGAILLSLFYVGYLAWQGWRIMRRSFRAGHDTLPSPLPWITVVVPAADEAGVIGGIAADLAAQDYGVPGTPRYDVLIVDDGSTDETAARAAAAAPGARVVRREPDSGPATKGAVLAWAMPKVRGEVVAVLDADSRVSPGFLSSAMAAWARDPDAAALQVQRRASNRRHAWLAAAQDEEQLMDMASQCGRWASDGTAELRGNGMFVRVDALHAAGGWPDRALTEDLDLSTRLTATGARVVLAPDVQVVEQAVERIGHLWRQRLRWAEGSLRRLIEHGPGLVANSRLPLGRRLDFVLFIGEFLIPPVFVASIAASLLTIPLPQPANWAVPITLFIGYGLGTYLLAVAGLSARGGAALSHLGRALRGALFLSHWLLIVPAALLKIAVGPSSTDFVRTPRAPTSA
ncbi:MAG TPA: glycosyltransferase family 2 protein [Candidatus Limnocylindria bacterium]|jgi:1,2-diacylglycerol 3-beta-glucosyltransferase|nr:glycosyltransferase family 2 protein [Candidatus Limnocylindria bacterium]